MIFVTAGTQLPFDRLIRAIDELAPVFPRATFIVQAPRGKYKANHIEPLSFVSPVQFNDYIFAAELVISHAGIGTITRVSEAGKPLILFPRMARLKEHRNDHQMDTCRLMKESFQLNIAHDQAELQQYLFAFFDRSLKATERIDVNASGSLVHSIRDFIGSIPSRRR